MNDIDEEVLQDLYSWVDTIALSRPKKNITRDFSDGVLMAEIVKHYFPKLIEIHNYPSCSGVTEKRKNWHLLNWKAFKKLNFELSDDVIGNLVDAKIGTIERVLLLVRTKIDRLLFSKKYDGETVGVTVGGGANRGGGMMGGGGGMMGGGAGMMGGGGGMMGGGGGMIGRGGGMMGGGGEAMRGTGPAGGQLSASARLTNQKHDPSYQKQGSIDYQKGREESAAAASRIALAEWQQECLAKEETIEILQAKIRKLEHLLELKDLRIEDLQRKLGDLRPTGGPMNKQGGR